MRGARRLTSGQQPVFFMGEGQALYLLHKTAGPGERKPPPLLSFSSQTKDANKEDEEELCSELPSLSKLLKRFRKVQCTKDEQEGVQAAVPAPP